MDNDKALAKLREIPPATVTDPAVLDAVTAVLIDQDARLARIEKALDKLVERNRAKRARDVTPKDRDV